MMQYSVPGTRSRSNDPPRPPPPQHHPSYVFPSNMDNKCLESWSKSLIYVFVRKRLNFHTCGTHCSFGIMKLSAWR